MSFISFRIIFYTHIVLSVCSYCQILQLIRRIGKNNSVIEKNYILFYHTFLYAQKD